MHGLNEYDFSARYRMLPYRNLRVSTPSFRIFPSLNDKMGLLVAGYHSYSNSMTDITSYTSENGCKSGRTGKTNGNYTIKF